MNILGLSKICFQTFLLCLTPRYSEKTGSLRTLPVFFSGTWYHSSPGLPHSQPKQFSFKQMIMLFLCLSPLILLCTVSVSVLSLVLITQIMKRLPMCLFCGYTFSSSPQRHTLRLQLMKEEQWIEFFHSHYTDKTGRRSLVKCRKMGARWGGVTDEREKWAHATVWALTSCFHSHHTLLFLPLKCLCLLS